MDVVQKHIIKSKAKKVQADLGLGGSQDGSSLGNLFGKPGGTEGSPGGQQDDMFSGDPAMEAYGNMPANYPPGLKLVYIDHSILSQHAQPPVAAARRLFMLVVCGGIVNLLVNILFAAVAIGQSSLAFNLLPSFIAALLLAMCQLAFYELAFRGVYRTSRSLQMWYMATCAVTSALCLLYALLDGSFCHGWLSVFAKGKDSSTSFKVVAGLEASYWTLLAVLSILTLWQHNSYRNSRILGLSSAARSNPPIHEGTGTDVEGQFTGTQKQGKSLDPKKARIEEIKSRYMTA